MASMGQPDSQRESARAGAGPAHPHQRGGAVPAERTRSIIVTVVPENPDEIIYPALEEATGMSQQYGHAPDGTAIGTGFGNPVTGNVGQQLGRVKRALDRLGIKFFELNRDVFGVGVGIAWDGDGFIVLSVSGPADGILNITVGILKNVSHERLRLLELCNSLTRDNTAFPVYLHDAPDGWDVHVQQRYLIDLLEEEPWFFRACVESLPATAETARAKFQEAGIAGEPYIWNKSDAQRLLLRSLV